MIARLNDFTINGPGSRVYLDEITGLGLPPLRTSSDTYSGRDGGFIGPQFYDIRKPVLTGRVFASSVGELEDARFNFQLAMNLTGNELRLTTNAGRTWLIFCRIGSFDMPIQKQRFSAPFRLELLAPDPVIYDDTAGAALSAPIAKIISGGYTFPVTYPYTYAASSLPTPVDNAGTVAVKPLITLNGTMNRPRVLNRASGLLVQLNDLVTGPSDVVEIDMRTSAVRLNGTSIYYKRSLESRFWFLLPGNNDIELSTLGSDDTVTGTVSWRAGVMGI